MLRVRVVDAEGASRTGGEELLSVSGNKWIDVVEPTEAVLLSLAERYTLHKLAIEDCLHFDQRPKLEEYPGHQFMVLQGFQCPEGELNELEITELHFFIGPDWLITVHDKEVQSVAQAWARVDADPKNTLGRGPDFAAYLVADALVDRAFPLLDRVNDEIEGLEDAIFEQPTRKLLNQAFHLKRHIVLLRRVLSPQRDVVGLMARQGIPYVQPKTNLYFRDVYDHLVRLYEAIDAARDMVSNTMDAWLSVTANKTNDITKSLTIYAAIFLPLSFIVGFFGQNFEVLSQPVFFKVMIASVVALPPLMVLWFVRKGWF